MKLPEDKRLELTLLLVYILLFSIGMFIYFKRKFQSFFYANRTYNFFLSNGGIYSPTEPNSHPKTKGVPPVPGAMAPSISMQDTNGRKFNGSTYLAIVTLPIPRAWWPSKPGLADHLQEISTSGRNYAVEGRIITYLAEAYLNFGYVGFFLIPAFMGYVFTAFCLWATAGPLLRLSRYVYLVIFMALVQTFRDGLLSIFVFTVVHNMPMLFALILHCVPGFAAKSLDRPAADPLAGEEEEEIAQEEARRQQIQGR